MNLAIRGIEANLGDRADDSFHRDLHPDLRADFVIANPPFNVSDWYTDALRDDPRWKYGQPPAGNGNYAWIQHFVHHLSPHGVAGFVLANGSLSSKTSGEGEIRKKLVESNVVDCIVALPEKLFFNAAIPVALWFLAKNRTADGFRDRQNEILFIDAQKLGRMENRTLRTLDADDIAKVAGTYHSWRNTDSEITYEDVPGFCKAASLELVTSHNFMLTPGRYVGATDIEDDGEPIEEKIAQLKEELFAEFYRSDLLQAVIRLNLEGLSLD
jgi:type I restriction enzyme M protein